MEEIKTVIAAVCTIAAFVAAIVAILGYIQKIRKWIENQNKQDEDIKQIKDEQCLVIYGLLACLKGLQEQGCNGPVTEAVNKIEKHINVEAHR